MTAQSELPDSDSENDSEPDQIFVDVQNLEEPRNMVQNLSEDFINGRALHLLLQVPVFSGQPGVRFVQWVRHVNNILEPTRWSNEDKIRALVDRLSGQAYDVYESVKVDGNTYADLVRRMKKIYHGQETSAYYQREFEDRTRKPGESIADYAYSLKNIVTGILLRVSASWPNAVLTWTACPLNCTETVRPGSGTVGYLTLSHTHSYTKTRLTSGPAA